MGYPKAIFVQILVISVIAVAVRSEVFSALATLTKALYNEKELAASMRKYVELEKERLDNVLKLAEEYDRHADTALVKPESYIANPINAFLFVKRFTSDLPRTKEMVSAEANSQVFLDHLNNLTPTLPDEEDLNGVVAAVLRLQDTYRLTAYDIAEGTFTPANRSPRLSAIDCYHFGSKAHESKDYYHVILWMQEALDRLKTEDEPTVDEALILDYLSFAAYNQGNLRHARNWTVQWLQIEPDHQRAQKNLLFYEKEIQKEEDVLVSRREPFPPADVLPALKNERNVDYYRRTQVFKDYESLCRGEDVIPNPLAHKLTCRYTTADNNPLLILAPVKVEEFYHNPQLVLFHDIISDQEVEVMKQVSTPKLKRATVNDPATGKLVTAHYRISKSAWLADEESSTVETVSKRISAVTGLGLERAELLQVQNYGIGGQYEPHYDFAQDQEPEKSTFAVADGNRIATFIFYFNDLDAGGYTVFTSLGVKVPPIKGAAAFWYNLKKSGDGDTRTRHAGCPVLAGSKWVANKWFHERGQEFRRPCGLSADE